MSYKNQFGGISQDVRRETDIHYNIHSHGDLGATYNHLANADLPEYARAFYSMSEHEMIANVKYTTTGFNYDKGLKNMHEALHGAPMEMYTPQPAETTRETSSAAIKTEVAVIPKEQSQEVIIEILKAQKEVMSREISFKEIEIEQEVTIKRKIKVRQLGMKQLRLR